MLKRTPIRRVSVKRAAQLQEYRRKRIAYLATHPICEVWLRENRLTSLPDGGWQDTAGHVFTRFELFHVKGAPGSAEIHHVNKRRGAMLNDERHWLAVCRKNHERIENDKAWARREGFLLNF